MKAAWYLSLGICCLIGCSVLFLVGSVLFSSYEVQRLVQEETAYPTPEEAFLALHSAADDVVIEGSESDLLDLWYVAGWEVEKSGKRHPVGNLFVSTHDGWIFVPESPRTLLMSAGLRLQSSFGKAERFNRIGRVWDRINQ